MILKKDLIGLGPNSNKIKEYKKSLIELNQIQKEASIGLVLGDASLNTDNKGKTYRLKFEWSDRNKAYVDHVHSLFDEWVLSNPHRKVRTSPKGNEVITWGFQTLSHEAFNFLAELFLENKKKGICQNLIKNHLTAPPHCRTVRKVGLSGLSLNNKVYFSTTTINLEKSNINPAVIYINAEIDKEKIIKENSKKSGIYRWTNLKTGFTYVGSSVNLGRRLSYYYYSSLKSKNMIINKAISKYGYSNFKLEILEYCKSEDCIKREQYYLDLLNPEYNILKIAGSTLGFKHSEETIAKFKKRKFTIEHMDKFKAQLKKWNQSEEHKLRAKERMLKLNEAKGIKVEVTDLRTNETLTYNSLRKTAEALNTDLKALKYNEKIQEKRGKIIPFKKHYIIKIKR